MPPSAVSAGLTARQREALEGLREFQMEWGYPPTRSELGDMLGVSAQTADFHLRALERKGFVEISGHARGVRVRSRAQHLCMCSRGPSSQSAISHTEFSLGSLAEG